MVLVKSFLFAALAASAAAKSAVIDLIPKNFDKVVLESGKPTLVEFFAPWCGHCKTLAPVWEELAFAFEHAKDKVQIAKVDADAERSIGKRFGVQGFPTLKFFDGKSDKPIDYKSGRDIESLVAFITEQTGVKPKKKLDLPSAVVMLNDKSFAETVGSDKNVLVAFTAPWCGHCKNLAPTWETVATDFANDAHVVIAKVDAEDPNSKALTKAQGVSSYPTIKFFPAGKTEATPYDGGRTEEAILAFINEQAGTHRVPGGDLGPSAGIIEELNTIAHKFFNDEDVDVTEVIGELKEEIKSIKDAARLKYAQYYVRVFEKIKSTPQWLTKETTRLQSVLSKGGLAPAKRDEIQAKYNVLDQFRPGKADEGNGHDEL
ncbi:Fc.00g052090.m01.CDS01 [Cosmosporella sp. VM-42]